MKKFMLWVAVVAVFAISSCSDGNDKDINAGFMLQYSTVDLMEDWYPVIIGVNRGSGEYEITVEDETVAAAKVITGEEYPHGAIEVTGKKIGATKLSVIDVDRHMQLDVNIRVNEAAVNFEVIEPILEIEIDDESALKSLKEDLVKQYAFVSGNDYRFSKESEGLLYTIRNNTIRDTRPFRHLWTDDELYLLLWYGDDTGDESARRLLVKQGEGYTAFTLYSDFFYRSRNTRATSHDHDNSLILGLEEDFTELYRINFPQAGVRQVKVIYAGYLKYAYL